MNIIIFAGGAGTRLWPISRKNSPKQFGFLVGDKSTLQMAVDRVRGFGIKNIYISTNEAYVGIVKEQIPDLPAKNILSEPIRRDLAAAVGLALLRLKAQGVAGTMAILWADHLMKNEQVFKEALVEGEKLIEKNQDRFVFFGEQPRFPNHNLGWIKLGKNIKDDLYEFKEWRYRPDLKDCKKMLSSGDWYWNPGYFVFDSKFVLDLYKKFMPKMYVDLTGMAKDHNKIKENYHTLESISFDDAIVQKVDPSKAVVLKVNMGWSDPGTLYALKEALEPSLEHNCEQGLNIIHNTKDSFICNEDREKLVAVIGMEGMIVVNTKEALLVCHKNDVPKVKELLKKMEENGLNKYL